MQWQWEIKMQEWTPLWNSASVEAAYQTYLSGGRPLYAYEQESIQFQVDFDKMKRISVIGSRALQRIADNDFALMQSLDTDRKRELRGFGDALLKWAMDRSTINDSQYHMLSAKIHSVTALFEESRASESPAVRPAADANRYYERFSGGFEGSFANVKTFFGGLDQLIGPCRKDVLQALEEEHTRVETGFAESDLEFVADGGNWTPRQCWHEVMDKTGTESVDYIFTNAQQLITASLVALGFMVTVSAAQIRELGLTLMEVIAMRLYTGPLYVLYNTVLRAYGNSDEPGRVAVGAHVGMIVRGCFTTTIHCISSGIIKLSQLQPCCHVWRGIRNMKLPRSFLDPNEHNTKGGVEFGFTSTSFDRTVAWDFAANSDADSPATVMKLRMSMINRGALIDWLSLCPDEKEALWPPLMGLENLRNSVDGRVTCYDMEPFCNLRTKTIEQLLGERHGQLTELTSMLSRDVKRKLIDARKEAADMALTEPYSSQVARHLNAAEQLWKEQCDRDATRNWEWCNEDCNFLATLKETIDVLDNVLAKDRGTSIPQWIKHLPKPECIDLEGHSTQITCLAVMPERYELASAGASDDGVQNWHKSNIWVRIWDCKSWTVRLRLEGFSSAARDLAWISDQDLLVGASLDAVIVWCVEDGRQQWKIEDPYSSVAYLSQSRLLATSLGGIITLRSADTGVKQTEWHLSSKKRVNCFLYIREHGCLASGHNEEGIALWTESTGEHWTLKAVYDKSIRALEWLPQAGRKGLLAVVGNVSDAQLYLLAAPDYSMHAVLDAYKPASVCWMPSPGLLASVGVAKQVIKLWSPSTLTERSMLEASSNIRSMAWLPGERDDKAKLVTAGDNGVMQVWPVG